MRRFPLLFLCWVASLVVVHAGEGAFEAAGSDGIRHRLEHRADGLQIILSGAGVERPDQTVFVAIGNSSGAGSALIPPEVDAEGSAVWLPFPADLLLAARVVPGGTETTIRRWTGTQWGPREKAGEALAVTTELARVTVRVPDRLLGSSGRINLAVYLKDMAADDGLGRLYGAIDPATDAGPGERVIRHHVVLERDRSGAKFRRSGRTDPGEPKVRIYQLLPRLFGNTNETRQLNGTIDVNGAGKFSDLQETALSELRDLGFTHLWLTGVLQQATATDYAEIGEPADDPDLLKGVAGSPYAIRDYFDVSPDYAEDPERRREEFKELIERVHAHGMKVLIDFVPNHVARSYRSTVRPELSFGAEDDRTKFFDPGNNFFYLTEDVEAEGEGPPLRLPTVDAEGGIISPTVKVVGGGDGLFEGEMEFGRVTGDDVVSWQPGRNTWYETVKLNYGYDFTDPDKSTRHYPHGDQPGHPVPDTWTKMDEVIKYWQEFGVDGFRADMAHMVPPEFWRWLISRSRERQPAVYWMAEAYDDDDKKVPGGDPQMAAVAQGEVMLELLGAGFDAVYDDPAYDTLKEIYDGTGTANDLDDLRPRGFFFDNALRYAENHDEVRLAAPSQWGGAGMGVGRPVTALLFGLSRGPVMMYHGQEVGEPAVGAEGFGRDDARTTIYDYWSMPEFAKWVNDGKFDGGRLSTEQAELRDFYRRLLAVVDEPAFRDGGFYPLNPDNLDNPDYGRLPGGVSGHWLYSYLRHDPASGQRMLVVVNLHPEEALRDVRVRLPAPAWRFLGWDALAGSSTVPVVAQDRLGEMGVPDAEITVSPAEMQKDGFPIKELQPLGAAYYELQSPADR